MRCPQTLRPTGVTFGFGVLVGLLVSILSMAGANATVGFAGARPFGIFTRDPVV